jgi:hypothetical protein
MRRFSIILTETTRGKDFSLMATLYISRPVTRAARLKGFEADLKLKGQEFATLLSILYVGYIIMQVSVKSSYKDLASAYQWKQIPSNMFLNYIVKTNNYHDL